ncbi:MAG: hypothetical protein IH584_07895, partial [Candidatus Aminicenantes bacterium]|nr:hypothetical protein [Candidatus Aminicenantes bacterium]
MNERLIVIIMVFAALFSTVAAAETGPASATVPMVLDHNRLTVEISFRRGDGSLRPAQAWVDTGGTTVILAEPLARELGVDLSAMPAGSEHSFAAAAPVPALNLGGIQLDTKDMKLSVRPGPLARPGVQAECVLPARCLRRLHVVFDYPARTLTVARPGKLSPRGTAVPCRVNPETGLFMVEATIDGEKVALGVDTGSAGTWLSSKLTAAWLVRHPNRPRAVGAAGSTNFFGFPLETKGALACLPALAIGSMIVNQEIAILGLDQGMFDWYSKKSAAPVAGFLGADLIARFRLEIDFPGQMTWWQPGPPPPARDLDIVPLTLRPDGSGAYFVAGVVERDGKSLVADVQPGDRLLKVDGLEVTGAPMGNVIAALRGQPGSI